MGLDYLDFEYSEDEDGNGTWDAMASVADKRWHALLAEVHQSCCGRTKTFMAAAHRWRKAVTGTMT
nr:hypothetical protein [Comamonas jiangduensis]